MLATFIGAIANVVICLLLVNHIGLWSAILGSFVAYFLMGIIRMLDATRFVRMKIDGKRFAINSIILIVQSVLVSMEIQIYLVSAIAIVLFALVNLKFIKAFLGKFKGRKNNGQNTI